MASTTGDLGAKSRKTGVTDEDRYNFFSRVSRVARRGYKNLERTKAFQKPIAPDYRPSRAWYALAWWRATMHILQLVRFGCDKDWRRPV